MKTANKVKTEKTPPKLKTAKTGRRSARKSSQVNGKHPPITYEHAPIGIVEASLEGTYINVNEEFCRIVGYAKEELLGRPLKDFSHEEDYPIDMKLHEQLVAGQIPFYRFEKRYSRKDGVDVWAELTRSIVRDEQGNPLYTIGAVLDISERKLVERVLRESVERLRLATEAAQMFTWEWDFQNNSYSLSDSFTQVLGFQTDLLSKNAFETLGKYIPAKDLQAVSNSFQKVVENKNDLHSLPCRVVNPEDGQMIWLEISAKIVYDSHGIPERMFGVAQNITESKNIQNEIAVISRMPEENPNPVMRINRDGRISYANPASAALLEDWMQGLQPVIPDELQTTIKQTFTSGGKTETEFGYGGKHFSFTVVPLVDAGYVNLYGKDITERKKAESDLAEYARQQEAMYQLSDRLHRTESLADVFDAALDAILRALQCDRASILLFDDRDVMRFVAWRGLSDAYRKATDSHSPWKPDAKDPQPISMDDIRTADLTESLRAVIEEEGIGALSFIPLVSNGKLIGKFMVYFNAPHHFDASELDLSLTIGRQLATAIDRRHAEEELRQSEERFRQAANASSALVYEVDLVSGTSAIVHGLESLTGYDPHEISASSDWWHSLIHPDDLPAHLAQLDELLKKGGTDVCEYCVLHKNGEWVFVQDNRLAILNERGEPIRLVGAVINITERKQIEEALRRNEKMFSTLVDAAPFGVYFIDSEFRLRAINKGSEAVFSGVDPLIGRDLAEVLRVIWQEPFATEAIEHFRHTLRTGESYISPPIIEERANINEIQAYDWQIHRITLADGTFGVVCYFYDLSEQKQMEAAVRASEALYRTIARNIPGGGVYVVDKDFRYLVAEGPVTEAFGLSRKMLEGHTVSEVFPDERGERMEARLQQNFAGETVSFETEHNGRVYWTQQAPLLDSIGQAIILTLDITERKRAEEALRQSEARFALFMQHLPGLAWIKDMQGRYVYANTAAEKAFSSSLEKLYGKTDEEIFPPRIAVQFKENDRRALSEGQGVQVIETLEQADGVLHSSLVSKFPIPGPDGSPALIGGTAFDITERLYAEEALRESEERFSAILRQATTGIVRKDNEGRLVFVNQAFCNMLGYTEADLLGKTVWEFMHPEDVAENKRSYHRLMAEGIPFNLERRLLRSDGAIIWVDASVSPIMDATGKPQSAVTVEVDITGRKQAEEALRQLNLQLEDRVLSRTAKLRAVNQTLRDEIGERKRIEEALRQSESSARTNEEKLRTLFDLLPVGISFLDPKGQIVQMNSALLNILKLSKEELLSQKYQARKYIRADGMPMSPAEFASARALTERRTVHNVETGILLEDGEVIWTNVSAAPVDVADVGVVVVTVDITDSKRAERALQESHRRLRILSQRLVEVQEDERRALARELHDRVGQTLAALNINLIIINGQLSGEATEQIGTRLNDSMNLVAETIALVRDVMTDLRPSVLDDYGLEAALESHLAQFISRYNISARLEKPDQPLPRLGPSVEMTVLRIAQEALMNIARHARATQVNLSLRQEVDAVCLTIQDNGIGIESWQDANRPGSHGLTIMRERAEAFDGTLNVQSFPGQGTVVELRIPYRRSDPGKSKEKKNA